MDRQMPELSMDEVRAKRLMIIGNSVVDAEKFAAVHPGGKSLIDGLLGSDATEAYRRANHSPKADKIVEKLTVGKIPPKATPVFTIADIVVQGMARLTKSSALYYGAGAEGGESVQEAVSSWSRYWLVPEVLVDVSSTDTSCPMLGGGRLAAPLLAAPTALLKMAHDEGEAAVARGCQRTGTGNCLSTTASMSLEEVASAAPDGYRWFQLYAYRDKALTANLLRRAAGNGYSAICVTVDLPVLGNRTSLEREGFSVPSQFKMANISSGSDARKDAGGRDPVAITDRKAYVSKMYDQNLTTDLLAWVAKQTSLPIVVKGVLSAASAVKAAGLPFVRGIVVSNHGGRQLNGAIPPAVALPRIARALAACNEARAARGLAPVELFVDGGIRKGSDVFKAIALGAKAVLVGRPVIYGLAYGGAEGVEKTFSILKSELVNCMQLCGARTLADISPDMVADREGPSRL